MTIKVLSVKDFNGNEVKNFRGENVGALPAGPHGEGRLVFLTTDKNYYKWNGATWDLIGGIGDMLAAVYDPTGVAGDAFDMSNMDEGGNAKVLTSTERSLIDSALQTGNIDTLAELNSIITDADLDDSGSSRPPTAHTHPASAITDFNTEVSNNASVAANTAKVTNQDPTAASATAGGITTTIITGYDFAGGSTIMNGMTLSAVPAGSYLVFFMSSVLHSSTSSEIHAAIEVAGSQVTNAETRWRRGGGQGDIIAGIQFVGFPVTLGSVQDINIHWIEITGGTATAFERSLSIIKTG